MKKDRDKTYIALLCGLISALLLGLLYLCVHLQAVGNGNIVLMALCLAAIPFISAIMSIIGIVVAVSEKKKHKKVNLPLWILALLICIACLLIWIFVAFFALCVAAGFIV